MRDYIRIVRPGAEDENIPRLAPGDRFFLGGIEYEYIPDRELLQTLHWAAHVRRSNLDLFTSAEGETHESYCDRIHDRLMENCLFFHLVASVVVKVGEVWTPRNAERNALAMCHASPKETSSAAIVFRLMAEISSRLFDGNDLRRWGDAAEENT